MRIFFQKKEKNSTKMDKTLSKFIYSHELYIQQASKRILSFSRQRHHVASREHGVSHSNRVRGIFI